MQAKKHLAHEIVKELHSEEDAKSAQEYFEKTVQNKELPENVETREFTKEQTENMTIADLLVELGMAESKSDAKRLVTQHALKINNETIDNPLLPVNELKDSEDKTLIQTGRKIQYITVK